MTFSCLAEKDIASLTTLWRAWQSCFSLFLCDDFFEQLHDLCSAHFFRNR
jgi:hypothetical protein